MNLSGSHRFDLHCPRCGYPVGECQARGDECTRLHMESAPPPIVQVHRVTPHVEPAPDPMPDPLEPPPREHAPRALLTFWAGWLGLVLVMVGLALVHVVAR